MNPIYNNRLYYAFKPTTFKSILVDLANSGNHIMGTREFINTRIVIPSLPAHYDDYFSDAGANIDEVLRLVKAIGRDDENYITDTYDSKHYTFLSRAIANAFQNFFNDCVQTRRAVIAFPPSHCFDSVQVLVRDGITFITINMRSCNAYKNLINDIYLIFTLIRIAMKQVLKNPGEISMFVNIGSLHLFKEDIKNVL